LAGGGRGFGHRSSPIVAMIAAAITTRRAAVIRLKSRVDQTDEAGSCLSS
jgi:hypothetical protein